MKRIVSIILLAATLCLCFAFVGCKKKYQQPVATNPSNNGGVGLVVDPNQGDYVAPETSAPAPGIAIPGWGEITLPPNETTITVDFFNPDANKGYYYLTFELYMTNADGTKDVLYKSGLIEPGKHIQQITLSHALAAGTYTATMHVQPYKMDGSLAATNNMDSVVTLKVIPRQ